MELDYLEKKQTNKKTNKQLPGEPKAALASFQKQVNREQQFL